MDEAREFYLKDMPEVEYRQSKYSVLNGCDTLVLLTEWLVGVRPVWVIPNRWKSCYHLERREDIDESKGVRRKSTARLRS